MKKAKIKLSTLGKIFNFLEKEKGEEAPQVLRYLSEPIPFEIAEENLLATEFQNGEPIPEARTEEEWVELGKKKSPAFMRNGNDVLYNHYAVMEERGICPPGWRVPTEEDLFFIMHRNLYKTFPLIGYRNRLDGSVHYAGSGGLYWSSTVYGSGYGSGASALLFNSSGASVSSYSRAYGLSVRCVRTKK